MSSGNGKCSTSWTRGCSCAASASAAAVDIAHAAMTRDQNKPVRDVVPYARKRAQQPQHVLVRLQESDVDHRRRGCKGCRRRCFFRRAGEPLGIYAERSHLNTIGTEASEPQRLAARELRNAEHDARPSTDGAQPRANGQRPPYAGELGQRKREQVVQRDRQRARTVHRNVEVRRPQQVMRSHARRPAPQVGDGKRRDVPDVDFRVTSDQRGEIVAVLARGENQRLPRRQVRKHAGQHFAQIGADARMAREAPIDHETGHRTHIGRKLQPDLIYGCDDAITFS